MKSSKISIVNFHQAEKAKKVAYCGILATSQIKFAPHNKHEKKFGEKTFFFWRDWHDIENGPKRLFLAVEMV